MSVIFRGLDMQADGLDFQITRGFLGTPDSRGEDYTVAAASGRSSGDRIADKLSVLLEGRIAVATAAEFRIATDALNDALDESGQAPGTLQAADGYLGLGAGVVATLTARVKNVIEGPIVAGGLIQTWSIELESVDPYWQRATP